MKKVRILYEDFLALNQGVTLLQIANYLLQFLFIRIFKSYDDNGALRYWGVMLFVLPLTGWLTDFKFIGKARYVPVVNVTGLPWYMKITTERNKINVTYHWAYIMYLKLKIEYTRARWTLTKSLSKWKL